jgi:hypothetical protein
MYADELTFSPEDLSWLDAPLQDLVFEDLPSIDEILQINPMTLSVPLPAGQSTYTQSVTIRFPRWLVAALKKQAIERGEKYQTYINLILAQHAKT